MTFNDRYVLARTAVKARLDVDCGVIHKLWSTWAIVASMALNEAVGYWPMFPDDLKQFLPHVAVKWFARISFPAIIVLRIIKQQSLNKGP